MASPTSNMMPSAILPITKTARTANGLHFSYPQCGQTFARELISAWHSSHRVKAI